MAWRKRHWSKPLWNPKPSSLARIKTFSIILSKRTAKSCGDSVEDCTASLISVKVGDKSFSLKWVFLIWISELTVRKAFWLQIRSQNISSCNSFYNPGIIFSFRKASSSPIVDLVITAGTQQCISLPRPPNATIYFGIFQSLHIIKWSNWWVGTPSDFVVYYLRRHLYSYYYILAQINLH